jgi:ActD protein
MAELPRQFVMAGFVEPKRMLVAARRMRETVKGEVETYTPYPVHGIDEALALPKSIVPRMVGTGALFGVLGGYSLLYWVSVFAYPLNVGGRPLHSAPAFIPITFECGVLLSALTAFFATLAWMGYPRLYHPVFEAPGFRRVSIDRFWISVELAGEDPHALQAELKELGAEETDFVTEQLET